MPNKAASRFWRKVEKTETCWLWTASTNGVGYGEFRVDGRKVYAHRYAYEQLVGPIPEGLQLDHLCRVRSCVRAPGHLEPVTNRENVLRGRAGEVNAARHRAKTHCPQGHAYDEANTYHHGAERHCRACNRIRNAKRRAA